MPLKSKDYFFVGLQLLLFLCYIWEGPDAFRFQVSHFVKNLSFLFMLLGFIIALLAVLQLNTHLSPFPTPRKAGVLISNGIFKYIRHPIYTGILILGLFLSLASGSFFRILLTAALFMLFYFKSKYEEDLLLEKFEAYETYKKTAGRFLPRW